MDALKSLFLKNILVKILSLVAALILWIFVMNDQNPYITNTITVPIENRNVPKNCYVTKNLGEVRLKFRAPRSLMANYNPADFSAYVDISKAKLGDNNLKIMASIPSGFEQQELSQDSVNVFLDEYKEVNMNVNIAVSGALAKGVALKEIKSDPSVVSLHGPSTVVDRVYKIAGLVYLNDQDADYDLSVNIVPIDDAGKIVEGVSINQNTVNVHVYTIKTMEIKTLTVHPVASGELPKGLSLEKIKVEPNKVEVTGEKNILESLISVDTEPLDLSKINGDTTIAVKILLPEGINLINGNEAKANVSIEIKK